MNWTNVALAVCYLGAAAIIVTLVVTGLMAYGGAAYHLENEKPAHIFLSPARGTGFAEGMDFSTAQLPVEGTCDETPGERRIARARGVARS